MPRFPQSDRHLAAAFHRVGYEHLVLGEPNPLEGDLAHRDLYTSLTETPLWQSGGRHMPLLQYAWI